MEKNPPLTPEEAAQILKISKYTLYELIKKGEIPAQRIGRQIRIDPNVLESYISSGVDRPADVKEKLNTNQLGSFKHELKFIGSHEPIVELLLEFWRYSSNVAISTVFTGSMEGLLALYKKQADLAGIHLWDEKTEEYNLPFVQYILPGESLILVNLVQRLQGWIVPAGNPKQLTSWEDIANKDLRFVNRQKGSGTRLRIDSYLNKANISSSAIRGYHTEESTHYGVAFRVACGEVDAGIGVEAAAKRMGLGFVPLFQERYDLVCHKEMTAKPEWDQLMTVLDSPSFHHAIESQPGYNTSLTGRIMYKS